MTSSNFFNGGPQIRWSPVGFRPHGARHASEVDRALQSLASEVFGTAATKSIELRADVRETATAYVLQLDVPGVAKEDITVDVDEKSVRIEATFKHAVVDGDTALTTLLSERVNGVQARNFRLPQAVDAEQAVAHHERGVLTLTLPKKNAATQKRLAIN